MNSRNIIFITMEQIEEINSIFSKFDVKINYKERMNDIYKSMEYQKDFLDQINRFKLGEILAEYKMVYTKEDTSSVYEGTRALILNLGDDSLSWILQLVDRFERKREKYQLREPITKLIMWQCELKPCHEGCYKFINIIGNKYCSCLYRVFDIAYKIVVKILHDEFTHVDITIDEEITEEFIRKADGKDSGLVNSRTLILRNMILELLNIIYDMMDKFLKLEMNKGREDYNKILTTILIIFAGGILAIEEFRTQLTKNKLIAKEHLGKYSINVKIIVWLHAKLSPKIINSCNAWYYRLFKACTMQDVMTWIKLIKYIELLVPKRCIKAGDVYVLILHMV